MSTQNEQKTFGPKKKNLTTMARNSNMLIKTKAGFQLVENTSVTR
jgi:hypothetical protein